MRDGRTRRLKKPAKTDGMQTFLSRYRARIVVLSGTALGEDFPLDRERVTLGRGPGVDLVFDNPAMSRQHAAIEYSGDGFRIRDLGSTNGIRVNGKPVQAGDIRNGDRFEIGAQGFRFVIEEREDLPDTYELPAEV